MAVTGYTMFGLDIIILLGVLYGDKSVHKIIDETQKGRDIHCSWSSIAVTLDLVL